MKILLVQAYLGRREKLVYPLGLAYLGAMLRDHEVRILDLNVFDNPYGALAERLRDFQPDVVGLSQRNVDNTQFRDPFVYVPTLRPTLETIIQHAPKARRIIGGSGFSIFARDFMLRFPEIEMGVLLEAEESFPELLADLDHPENATGVLFRRDGEIVQSSPPRLLDFNALPTPRWDLIDAEPYKGQVDAIGIQSKRGCILKCAYCTYSFLNGAYYRLRDPQKIVADIAELKRLFDIDRFMFVDSIFNIPEAHAVAICEEIIRQKLNVPWSAWFNERAFSEDFYKLAREAGCKYFSFSPDGFSEKTLKILQKNSRVEDIYKVYEIAKKSNGAEFGFNFFINPPGQTYKDFFRLMIFWQKARYHLRDKQYGFGLTNIRIEPDTAIYRLALEQGVIRQDTNLLPETQEELHALFYTNPDTPLIDLMFRGIEIIAKLKRRIAS